MIKALQKIMLLVAVATVTGHSVFPHIHYSEATAASQHRHDDDNTSPGRHHHHDEEKNNEPGHGIFSLAQLDDDFILAKKTSENFQSPTEFISLLAAIIFTDHYPVNTKTHFGWYREYPPPGHHLSRLPSRAPPALI
ncbi:MAG: hypothetical protein SFU87_06370 [Chitinophagaceae bacterium]|nr:hypothetical protein [Chitinophagaceae bacterium]